MDILAVAYLKLECTSNTEIDAYVEKQTILQDILEELRVKIPSTTQSQLSTILKKRPFYNIGGKGENAGTSIFSFSRIVFYQFQTELLFLYYIHLVVCKYFQFGRDKKFVYGKEIRINSLQNDRFKFTAFAED